MPWRLVEGQAPQRDTDMIPTMQKIEETSMEARAILWVLSCGFRFRAVPL